jgi:polyisoprenoid-binding protein YceI
MLLSVVTAVLLVASPLAPTDSSLPTRRPAAEGPAAAVETWQVDVAHSELSFRVRHFMSKVRGSFGGWSGTVQVDPADWTTAKIDVDIKTASIDTQNERRDNHLRSGDFFAADSFPTIMFRSTKVTRKGADGVVLEGQLTMRGVTRPVTLEGRLLGTQKDAQGRQRAGIEARGIVNRVAHGVTWNRMVEGAQMLGEEVEIEIALELVRQDAAAAN